MDNFFDSDSWIMVKLGQLGDLIIANLLFVITSIPLITLGASTTALYAVMKGPDENVYSSSVFKHYFRAFFANFKKSTMILLILLIPGAIVLVNLYILLAGLMENSVLNYILCAIPIVVFVFAWNYVFPLTAKFENTIRGTFANAFVLSVLHLPTTVALTVLNLIPLAVFLLFTNFFYKTLVVWVLLVFALIAKINSLLLKRVFDRHMQEPAAT